MKVVPAEGVGETILAERELATRLDQRLVELGDPFLSQDGMKDRFYGSS